MTSPVVEVLSAREAEVLEALGEHLTNAEIARRLHISVRTVESHVSALLRKLAASDRRALAALALARSAAPPTASPDILGLPASWTSFVGRAGELEEVAQALAASRLVTLVGPGGIGKTRLAGLAAERAAADFPAGGAFVDLVPVTAGFVVPAVAAALGVVERAQEPLAEVVHERLRAGRDLLVLDNCEHVLGSVAGFVQALLAACPETVVLATSRERLGLPGERLVQVRPLGLGAGADPAEAERLFVDRAGGPAGVDADPTLVAEICRRLDRMPLAIELAAARTGSLGVDGLLAGLEDHLRLLSRPAGDDRHGSLRTVIEWSHQLLDDDERSLFRRLSTFAEPFDLAAAVAVAAGGDAALATDVIGRLTDKSLLEHRRGATGSRWRMLATVQAFAREELDASGEAEEIRDRHLRWATAAAQAIEAELDGVEPWQERFDAVVGDLRAATMAAVPTSAGDGTGQVLAAALGHLAYARGFLAEAGSHFAEAVARAPDEATAIAALRVAADAAFAQMRGDIAFELLHQAFERASAVGDRTMAAIVLADASSIAGRAPATFAHPLGHEQLVALAAQARSTGPEDDPAVAAHVALAAAWDGARGPTVPDPMAATEALRLARRLDDPVLISGALDAVASAVFADGHLKEAARVTRERLDLLDRLPRHDPRVGGEVADIYHMATETAMAAGELPAALASARLAHVDSARRGLPHFAATHIVPPLALQGAFDEALAHAAVMRDGWERSGTPTAGWMAPSFFATALVHGLRAENDRFQEWWALALRICTQTRFNSFSLFVEPRIALHLGQVDRAAATARTEGQETAGSFDAYARAMAVEVSVAIGHPDAGRHLEALRPAAAENDFVAAMLARATGRLRQDEDVLLDAVRRWEAIGARFERACTLALLPDRAAEGHQELAALGCPPPAEGLAGGARP